MTQSSGSGVMDRRKARHGAWGRRIDDLARHERGCWKCRKMERFGRCSEGYELSIRMRDAHIRYLEACREFARATELRRLSSRTVGYLGSALDGGDELRGVVKGLLLGLIAWLILSVLRGAVGD